MHKSRQPKKGWLRLPWLACHKLFFIAIKIDKLNLSFYADKYIIIIHFTLCIHSLLKVNLLLIYLLILSKHLLTRVGVVNQPMSNWQHMLDYLINRLDEVDVAHQVHFSMAISCIQWPFTIDQHGV